VSARLREEGDLGTWGEYDAHITYTALKRLYEEHLTVARQLVVPQSRAELHGGG